MSARKPHVSIVPMKLHVLLDMVHSLQGEPPSISYQIQHIATAKYKGLSVSLTLKAEGLTPMGLMHVLLHLCLKAILPVR